MRKHLILASLIVAFEGYVGIGLIGMYGIIATIAFAILALAQRQRRWEWFRVALVYTLMFVATVAVLLSNIKQAQRRADPVISAVNRYHSERGRYPNDLDELVPAYLPAIPRAGFTLLSRHYRYYPRKNNESLQLWFAAMFHGIFAYDFQTASWRTND